VVHQVDLADRSQSIPAADSTWPFEHSIRSSRGLASSWRRTV
jgi:hypothetical protein